MSHKLPPTYDMISTLEDRGFERFCLKGPLCVCPMHKDDPQGSAIPLESLSYTMDCDASHRNCWASNIRQTVTGRDEHLLQYAPEDSFPFRQSPHKAIFHSLPVGLSMGTTCEATGMPILGSLIASHNLSTATNYEKGSHNFEKDGTARHALPSFNRTLPHSGISFFAYHRPGASSPIFVADNQTAVEEALKVFTNSRPKGASPWTEAGQDEAGRTVILCDKEQLGIGWTFHSEMPEVRPVDWYRSAFAWSAAARGRSDNIDVTLKTMESHYDSLKGFVSEQGQESTIESIRASIGDVLNNCLGLNRANILCFSLLCLSALPLPFLHAWNIIRGECRVPKLLRIRAL